MPLPHGTEVTLRVEREVSGRRVPQGAAGRVHQLLDGGMIEIMVVGVGVGLYRRDELVPRQEGQARFARRRATDWDALTPCRVLEATVGSRAWGLSDEGSDTDLRGLFALPLPWTLGLLEPPGDLVSAARSLNNSEAAAARVAPSTRRTPSEYSSATRSAARRTTSRRYVAVRPSVAEIASSRSSPSSASPNPVP